MESEAICLFSSKNVSRVVSFTHHSNDELCLAANNILLQLNIICSQTQLDDIAHEQTITCSQLFAGHVVGFQPMKRKKNLHRMIMHIVVFCLAVLG